MTNIIQFPTRKVTAVSFSDRVLERIRQEQSAKRMREQQVAFLLSMHDSFLELDD
jgi:hypothetical protein